MQQTECTDEHGRRVIQRQWRNTEIQLHRTTGPAVEEWTVLPGGGHMLSYQGWCVNGRWHREGRPAVRYWHVAEDGTRVLFREEWWRHGSEHRMERPSYRRWTVELDGIRRLAWESWRVNGKLHRVDGPAYASNLYWYNRRVKREDLPWNCFLTAFTGATHQGGSVSPAWSRDARVAMTEVGSASGTPSTYCSAVGGAMLLCV